jgi:hypothetical protein
MFKSTKTKIIGLTLVGAMAVSGAVYATSALAGGGATAAPATLVTTNQTAPVALTTQTVTDPQLRATILEMLKDRMGLTAAGAEKFADQMIARMQSVNPNFDLKAMVNWCSKFIDANANGRGMMGGNGSAYGRGMMGTGTAPNGATPQGATPNGTNRGYCNPGSASGGASSSASSTAVRPAVGPAVGSSSGRRGMMGGGSSNAPQGMMGGRGMMGASGAR